MTSGVLTFCPVSGTPAQSSTQRPIQDLFVLSPAELPLSTPADITSSLSSLRPSTSTLRTGSLRHWCDARV